MSQLSVVDLGPSPRKGPFDHLNPGHGSFWVLVAKACLEQGVAQLEKPVPLPPLDDGVALATFAVVRLHKPLLKDMAICSTMRFYEALLVKSYGDRAAAVFWRGA